MDKTVTIENLIAFAYNETEILETVNVVDAIDNDEDTAEEYEVILATMDVLEKSSREPSIKVLDRIFLYANGRPGLHLAN
jgi:hypothetical protein